MQDATQADDEDCTITGVETQHGPACSIDGKPLFDDAIVGSSSRIMRSGRLASSVASRMESGPLGTMNKRLRARESIHETPKRPQGKQDRLVPRSFGPCTREHFSLPTRKKQVPRGMNKGVGTKRSHDSCTRCMNSYLLLLLLLVALS
jgi:hypothetical protein